MKQIISAILAGSVLFAACSKTSSKGEPSPRPASKEQIDQSNESIKQEGIKADQAENGDKSQAFSLAQTALNAAVKKMRADGDLFIKDAVTGVNLPDDDVASYQKNPTAYLLAFKNENATGADAAKSYYVLKTKSVSSESSDKADLSFNVYTTTDVNNVKESTLGTAKLSESLTLYKSLLRMGDNKKNIDALKARVEGTKIVSNKSMMKAFSDFLFPTAEAGTTTYKKKLMITAICFSSVAVVSYIFAWQWTANIATAGSIVFWLLYWFTPTP